MIYFPCCLICNGLIWCRSTVSFPRMQFILVPKYTQILETKRGLTAHPQTLELHLLSHECLMLFILPPQSVKHAMFVWKAIHFQQGETHLWAAPLHPKGVQPAWDLHLAHPPCLFANLVHAIPHLPNNMLSCRVDILHDNGQGENYGDISPVCGLCKAGYILNVIFKPAATFSFYTAFSRCRAIYST